MPDYTRWDKLFATASWVLAAVLLYSAISLWVFPPTGAGPVGELLGILGAQLFYSVLYGSQALLLAYAKVKKKKKMRKYTLMFIYLTGFFTSILSVTLLGWSPKLIDNFALASLAAICWLYWTFRTEYINPTHFQKLSHHLKQDS